MDSGLLDLIQFHDATKQLTPEGRRLCNNDYIEPDEIEYIEWKNGFPTLYLKEGPYENVWIQNVIDAFIDEFPIFKYLDMDNVVIAGGCVSKIIESLSRGKQFKSDTIADIDMFFYGISVEEANQKVITIGEKFNSEYPGGSIERSKNAITFRNKTIKFQIILRIYETPSQILHGFDLGSSMIGILAKKSSSASASGCSFPTAS